MDNLEILVGKTVKAIVEKDNFIQIVFTDGSFIIIGKDVIPSQDLLLPEVGLATEEDDDEEEDDGVEEDSDEDLDDEDDDEDEDEDEDDDPDEDGDDEDEDDDEDFWTKEDIDELDREELEELISDEDLSIDPEDFPSDKKLRKAVVKALGL